MNRIWIKVPVININEEAFSTEYIVHLWRKTLLSLSVSLIQALKCNEIKHQERQLEIKHYKNLLKKPNKN